MIDYQQFVLLTKKKRLLGVDIEFQFTYKFVSLSRKKTIVTIQPYHINTSGILGQFKLVLPLLSLNCKIPLYCTFS